MKQQQEKTIVVFNYNGRCGIGISFLEFIRVMWKKQEEMIADREEMAINWVSV